MTSEQLFAIAAAFLFGAGVGHFMTLLLDRIAERFPISERKCTVAENHHKGATPCSKR